MKHLFKRFSLILALVGLAFTAGAAEETLFGDDVFEWRVTDRATLELYYIWKQPATVYAVSMAPGEVINPGQELMIVKPDGRSKGKLHAGASMKVLSLKVNPAEIMAIALQDLRLGGETFLRRVVIIETNEIDEGICGLA